MRRCAVLGGGGPVGIGWQAGLLVGLARDGVDISNADSVIGTSAGSVVGFTLASGGDLTQATDLVRAAGDLAAAEVEADPALAESAAQGLEQLLTVVAEAAADPARAQEVRARLGAMAVAAPTMSEAKWLATFDPFAEAAWPDGFSCTAVDVGDGRFRVWDQASGLDVRRAIASSCAVPCVFPPVTIGASRWMDGGVRDMVNADLAAGHEAAVVVSCTVLEIPKGFDMAAMEAVFSTTRAHIAGLRDTGTDVEVVVPGAEMLEISGWGLNLMDFSLAGAAYEAGIRQGKAEADRLARVWTT